MNANKITGVSVLHRYVDSIREDICDYVCQLDIPAFRALALQATPLLANEIHAKNFQWNNATSWVLNARTFLRLRMSQDFCLDLESVENDSTINCAIRRLEATVSNHNDRIIACRQIDAFPMRLKSLAHRDPALDGNGHYIADVVYSALENIVRGIVALQEMNLPKKGE